MSTWSVLRNGVGDGERYSIWRVTHPTPEPGDNGYHTLMETRGAFVTHEEAQAYADKLNGGA